MSPQDQDMLPPNEKLVPKDVNPEDQPPNPNPREPKLPDVSKFSGNPKASFQFLSQLNVIWLNAITLAFAAKTLPPYGSIPFLLVLTLKTFSRITNVLFPSLKGPLMIPLEFSMQNGNCSL